MRYDFGNEYYKREEMQNIYHQIGAEVEQVGLVYDCLKKMREEVGSIKDFLAQAHNLRQEVANLKAAVADNKRLANKIAADAVANLKILENRLDNFKSQSAIGSDINNLSSRISSLESRVSSLGNGGGSSNSGGVSV
ncbi:4795_t:CDS:1, partial [Ambispora gerdemannii]